MNNDTIRRADAVKAVSISCVTCLAKCAKDCEKCSVPKLRELINAIPSADRPQEWIPCSERLPEEYKRVLITTAWECVYIGWLRQNKWSTDSISNLQDFVLAWMPLPSAYQGKGVDDEH